jgi:predicted RNase H-like nuclease (RuvC/YqgF family)
LKAGITAQAQSAQIAPHDVARMIQLVLAGKEIEEAVDQVQQEAQQRQATQAPAPDESQGQVTSPEAQPGLAQPGVGAEQPTVAPPTASTQNLSDLLNAMRRPQRESPAEKGAA